MAKKVLIIDDSATQLNSLKIFFKREGWEVATASDGVEAYMEVYDNPPDVMISDIVMPNLSGFQLCRLLKSDPNAAKIPIALLTVLDRQIDKFWASQSGANKFILKNSDFSKIINEATELAREFPLSDDDKKAIMETPASDDGIIAQINKILDDALMSATLTNEFRSIVDYTLSDEQLSSKIFGILSTIVEYDVAGLFFEFPDKSVKKNLMLDVQNVRLSNEAAEKISQRLLRDKVTEVSILGESKNELTIENIEDFASYIEFEFHYKANLTGKACFYTRNKVDWDKLKFIGTLKNELDLFFRLKFLYDQTQFLSLIDDLTGLYTRRHLDETLSQEFERARRYRTKVAVSMSDIDDFKKINDTYGHQAGDVILKGVAKIFQEDLRKTDFVYRYGGEEFFVIMPETPLENVAIPLERIRRHVENANFTFNGQKIPVTISIGASSFGKDTANYMQLVESADQALYRAKRTGKNKVILCDE